MYAGFRDWIENSLIIRSSNSHKKHKKFFLPCFHTNLLHIYMPAIEENARKLHQKMKENNGKGFRFLSMVKKCTFDILYDTILGIDKNSPLRKNMIIHEKVLSEILHSVSERAYYVLLWSDTIFYLTKKGRKFKRNKEILRQITKEIVNEKLKQRNEVSNFNENRNEQIMMLDRLLNSMEENPELTMENLYQDIELLFAAGHDTTAITICWSLYLLGKYPEVQKKVKDELKTIFGDDNIRTITEEDLKEMKYLECAIKETMRMYSTIPFISRKLNKPLKLGDKLFTGEWICCVSLLYLHRNPSVFENPESFYPDRFLPENCSKIPPYAFIPFSFGSRMCIGYRLAMIEVKIILATILRNSTVESVDTDIKNTISISLYPTRPFQLRMKSEI